MGLGGDGYAYGLDDVDKSTLTPKTHWVVYVKYVQISTCQTYMIKVIWKIITLY